jgi:hypothetical protein
MSVRIHVLQSTTRVVKWPKGEPYHRLEERSLLPVSTGYIRRHHKGYEDTIPAKVDMKVGTRAKPAPGRPASHVAGLWCRGAAAQGTLCSSAREVRGMKMFRRDLEGGAYGTGVSSTMLRAPAAPDAWQLHGECRLHNKVS